MKYLSVFRNIIFRYLFVTSIIALLGEGMFTFATMVVIMKQTNSVMAIGSMVALTMLPSVFLSPIEGVFIDKANKVKIASICNIFRFFIILILLSFLYYDLFSLKLMNIVVLVYYIFWYFLVPTMDSMLKEALAEDEYIQGVSLTQGAWQVGGLISALLSGTLMNYVGINITLVISGIINLSLGLIFMKIIDLYDFQKPVSKEDKITKINSHFISIKQGFYYIISHKSILYFSLVASVAYPFLQAINVLIVPFNYRMINGNEFSLGVIDSAAGIGGLVSVGLSIFIFKKQNASLYLILSMFLLAVSTLSLIASNSILIAFANYILIGFFAGNFKVLSKSIIYEYVDSLYTGRIMTTISMLSLFLAVIYTLCLGFLGDKDITLAYYTLTVTLVAPMVLAVLGRRAVSSGELPCKK